MIYTLDKRKISSATKNTVVCGEVSYL